MKNQETILSSAKKLFWKYGIQKVTVEEICKEAGVSKMTFYRRYANKDHAAVEILEQLMRNGIEQHNAIMHQNKPFPEKINELLELKYQESTNISAEFINDIYRRDDSELSDIIQEYSTKSEKLILSDFENAKKEGWVREGIKPEFILYILHLLQEKIQDEKFIALFANTKEAIVQITDFFFYGMFNKDRVS